MKNNKKINVEELVKECENDPEIMKGSKPNKYFEPLKYDECWHCGQMRMCLFSKSECPAICEDCFDDWME